MESRAIQVVPKLFSKSPFKGEEFSAVSGIVPLSRGQCPAAVGDDSGPSFLKNVGNIDWFGAP